MSVINPATTQFSDRLGEVFARTLSKVGPEARVQLQAIVSADTLKIIATVLLAWVAAHAVGLGEIIDVILLATGVLAIGWAVFEGIDHLYEFAATTYAAKSSSDLDRASDHLAKAISILGIQATLAVLFRGAKNPRTGKGGRLNPGPSPPKNQGWRYKPQTRSNPNAPVGSGFTDWWGDITVSTRGTMNDRELVLLHEKVHQFFVPKLYLIRAYRVSNRLNSYVRSSLYRYIEEALAETIAQVGVNGFKSAFVGLRFPVKNGYVFLKTGGSSLRSGWHGSGVLVEGASLVHTGMVAGIAIELWFTPDINR